MPRALKAVDTVHDRIALRITSIVGSMWTFYLFAAYGVLPVIPCLHATQATLLYWGNALQLILLPLIMVGGNVIDRTASLRARSDHETLLAEMQELKKMQAELKILLQHASQETKYLH